MRVAIYRDQLTPLSTEGKLFVDGAFACFTLELPIKDGKPGSAIPAGVYQIELSPSPKFLNNPDPFFQPYAARMPHVANIPGRSLIMLHPGNQPKDTDGCILIGETRGRDLILRSREAFTTLYPKLVAGCGSTEGCEIQVVDPTTTHDEVQEASSGG